MTVKVGEIETPEFQGTHLWNRLGWAKENLEMVRSEYCIVWEDPNEPDEPTKVTHPDPNWMACALQEWDLTPVTSYWELEKRREHAWFCQTHKRARTITQHETNRCDDRRTSY